MVDYFLILYMSRGGARPSSNRAEKYYVDNTVLFIKSTDETNDWCALASIANGVGCLFGEAEAKAVMRNGPMKIGPFGKPKEMSQTSNWVNKNLSGVSLKYKPNQREDGWNLLRSVIMVYIFLSFMVPRQFVPTYVWRCEKEGDLYMIISRSDP